MKRLARISVLGCALLFPSLGLPSAASAQDAPATLTALAPADSYFGHLRMSVLGMRNAIRDVSLRIDGASADDLATLFHKLTLVEDAVLDLREHYPQDSWLPQFGLSLAQTFARMPYHVAQIHANDALDWVIGGYPATNQAFYAYGMRHARAAPVATTMDVPIEPVLPSYAVPESP